MARDRRKIEKKRKQEAAKAKRAVAHAAAKKRKAERPKVSVDPTGGDPVQGQRRVDPRGGPARYDPSGRTVRVAARPMPPTAKPPAAFSSISAAAPP